jgi:hypothetical protein
MIFGNRLFEAQLIEKLALTLVAPPHHRPPPSPIARRETESRSPSSFNAFLQHCRHFSEKLDRRANVYSSEKFGRAL